MSAPVLPRVTAIRIVGTSMEPVLQDGEIVCLDPTRTTPALGEIVGIRYARSSGIVGYWMMGDRASLGKANPAFQPVLLDALGAWSVAGTIVAVVNGPMRLPVPPPDVRRIEDVLNLSLRALRLLRRARILTIGDLLPLTEWRLGMIRGLGVKTRREILAELVLADLALSEGRP